MEKLWSDRAWDDYLFWQKTDKKLLRKINELLRDCERSPFDGLGKPEPLKHDKRGYWSRRITEAHRLVYRVEGDQLRIASCKDHYEN
jgi:toxin YoeB